MTPDTLRAWRDSQNLTRREAADALGINQRTLEDLEYGRSPRSPLWGPIERLIAMLGMESKTPPA